MVKENLTINEQQFSYGKQNKSYSVVLACNQAA